MSRAVDNPARTRGGTRQGDGARLPDPRAGAGGTEASSAPAPTTATLVAYCVGLAFLWPCTGSFVTMRFRHVMVGSASLITPDLSSAFMSALFAIAVVAGLALRVPIGRALRSSRGARIAGVGALLGLVGHLSIVYLPKVSSLAAVSTAAVAASLVLSVAFVVMHVLGWGEALSRLGSMAALTMVVFSNALSYALQMAIDLVPGNLMLGFLVLCPLGSGAMLALVLRRMPARKVTVADDDIPLREAFGGIPWRFVIPTILLSYFEQVISSLLFQRYPAWSRDYLTITLLCCCAVWTLAGLWLASGARRAAPEAARTGAGAVGGGTVGTGTRPRSIEGTLLALFSVLLVLYMAALLVTVIFPDAAIQVPVRLMVAVGSCLRTFLFCTLVWAICEGTTTVTVGMLTFVLLSLALQVSRLSALLFTKLGAQTLDTLTSPQLVVPVIGVMMFSITACLVVVEERRTRRMLDLKGPDAAATAREAGLAGAGGLGGAPAGARAGESGDGMTGAEGAAAGTAGQLSYAQVAHDAGLTKRETEVFDLVCHGYSARAAGERLGISESTVVSHVTHIHRKFGVSSKQDLIAEVERRRSRA
ncbi:MAG: helix-turn-helix transcriptional regulator [Coriobacteriales bacterium]|jgi:DNA-binding CsgD family transcriptional regulator